MPTVPAGARVRDRVAFFFAPTHRQAAVHDSALHDMEDGGELDTRWVHVVGHDNLTLLRLAVKYGYV